MVFENETIEITDTDAGNKRISALLSINTFFSTGVGYQLHGTLYYLLAPLVMLTAILTNCINIIVFIRGRIYDSMALVFLGLAVSDLLYNALSLATRLFNAAHTVLKLNPYLNLIHVSYLISRYSNIWNFLSPLLTVLIAVQKCACVAAPFFFRNYFTQRKSAVNVIVLYSIMIVYHIPTLYLDGLAPYYDKGLNRTRLGYAAKNPKVRLILRDAMYNINRIAIPIVSQGIVITCVAIMTVKLHSAANFRRKMASPGINIVTSDTAQNSENTNIRGIDCSVQQDDKTTAKGNDIIAFNTKELRVIQSVNFVCVIFIAGMAPTTVIQALNAAYDEFSDIGLLAQFYFFIDGIRQTAVCTSMAVNIFVYYKYNRKYKATFTSVFLCGTRK